jgi:hypothetical protein
MTDLNSQYVNERQSDLRRVKEGWYAMNEHGDLIFGPFSNRENCVAATDKLTPACGVNLPFVANVTPVTVGRVSHATIYKQWNRPLQKRQ